MGAKKDSWDKVLSIRLPGDVLSSITRICEENNIQRSKLIFNILEVGLLHLDDEKLGLLLGNIKKEMNKEQLLAQSNRVKFISYFLKNAMKVIITIARIEYVCNRTVPMGNIKAIIKDSEAIFESFNEEEKKRTFSSLEALKGFLDESKVIDLVSNITKVKLIKDG